MRIAITGYKDYKFEFTSDSGKRVRVADHHYEYADGYEINIPAFTSWLLEPGTVFKEGTELEDDFEWRIGADWDERAIAALPSDADTESIMLHTLCEALLLSAEFYPDEEIAEACAWALADNTSENDDGEEKKEEVNGSGPETTGGEEAGWGPGTIISLSIPDDSDPAEVAETMARLSAPNTSGAQAQDDGTGPGGGPSSPFRLVGPGWKARCMYDFHHNRIHPIPPGAGQKDRALEYELPRTGARPVPTADATRRILADAGLDHGDADPSPSFHSYVETQQDVARVAASLIRSGLVPPIVNVVDHRENKEHEWPEWSTTLLFREADENGPQVLVKLVHFDDVEVNERGFFLKGEPEITTNNEDGALSVKFYAETITVIAPSRSRGPSGSSAL